MASDGTIPLQRVEPVSDPRDNVRRVIASRVPNKLIGGQGVLREGTPCGGLGQVRSLRAGAPRAPEKVAFVKLGQTVATREADDSIVLWAVSSEPLGEPVKTDDGKLAYQDTCFRNPNLAGKDTAGYAAVSEILGATCVVEDMNQEYNALSVGGFAPLSNYANMAVPTANEPGTRHAHPDGAHYLGFDGTSYNYTGTGAALNDINGAERDSTTNYMGGEHFCHMIVGKDRLQVPGAKRPATRSLPVPGSINSTSFIVWRPVNPNINIANDWGALAPDPIEPAFEPAPEPAEVPVDADAILPM